MVQFLCWFQLSTYIDKKLKKSKNKKKSIFVFDSHSWNSQGFHIPNRQSVLLEFRSIKPLNLFIMKYYEKNYGSTSTLQYSFLYIKVKTSKTAPQNVLDSLQEAKEQTSPKKMCINTINIQCGKCWYL